MSNCSILVLTCDKYDYCWDWFFACKEKYWQDCPYPTYLVTETKDCKHCQTIKSNSPIWTKRFRDALRQIDTDYILLMLEDYFIRQPVKQSRINQCFDYMLLHYDPITWNFEKNYREAYTKFCPHGWVRQRDRQVYLNSTQPGIWHRNRLIERLSEDQSPWQWELTSISSNYDHYINVGGQIIDNGYRYGQEFGVKQGELTDECKEFLSKEKLL